jgi:hypothetical protein
VRAAENAIVCEMIPKPSLGKDSVERHSPSLYVSPRTVDDIKGVFVAGSGGGVGCDGVVCHGGHWMLIEVTPSTVFTAISSYKCLVLP